MNIASSSSRARDTNRSILIGSRSNVPGYTQIFLVPWLSLCKSVMVPWEGMCPCELKRRLKGFVVVLATREEVGDRSAQPWKWKKSSLGQAARLKYREK